MRNITLIITLSDAEHLIDEIEGDYIYIGPRFQNDKHHIRSAATFRLSKLVQNSILKEVNIKYIMYYCDIFSLALFQPVLDIMQCKTIAIIGDTHHGKEPLSKLITWLYEMKICRVALKQTVHHKPIFRSFGFDVLQLPYYAHNTKSYEVNDNYIERIIFYGSISNRHVKRMDLLKFLKQSGLTIDICAGSREMSFKAYNTYCASINMPLNNDVNYRIYEIMSAGGVCVTENFISSTEDSQLAKNKINILQFESPIECYNLCVDLLKNRNLRNNLARRANYDISQAKSQGLLYILIKAFIDENEYNAQIRMNNQKEKSMFENLKLYEDIQIQKSKGYWVHEDRAMKQIPSEWRTML